MDFMLNFHLDSCSDLCSDKYSDLFSGKTSKEVQPALLWHLPSFSWFDNGVKINEFTSPWWRYLNFWRLGKFFFNLKESLSSKGEKTQKTISIFVANVEFALHVCLSFGICQINQKTYTMCSTHTETAMLSIHIFSFGSKNSLADCGKETTHYDHCL